MSDQIGWSAAMVAPKQRGQWRAALVTPITCLVLALMLMSPGYAQDRRLTGVWRGTEVSALGMMHVEAIFFPNGTYSRLHVLGALTTHDSGEYDVVQNWIHFSLKDWGPTDYLGQPLTWPTSDTWIVTHFQDNVLETATIHLERVQ